MCKRLENFLISRAKQFSSKTAIISIDENLEASYDRLFSDSKKIAGYILGSVGAGDGNIVLCVPNSYSFVSIMFGILLAGKTVIPVSPKASKSDLDFILHDSRPQMIFKDDIFTYHGEFDRTPKNTNDNAFIIYTSGSTGNPKGVICPHGQMLFAINAINSIIPNSSNDRILCGLPFSFDYGLYQIFLALDCGAAAIIMRDFSTPAVIPGILYKYKITGFPGVPSLFSSLLESRLFGRIKLESLRYMCSTGDVFHHKLVDSLKNEIPSIKVYKMYGLTECKRVSILDDADYEKHKNSVGRPLPNTEVKIINECGEEVACGEVGELVVAGPHTMSGYLNNKIETAKKFKKNSSDGKVYLHTNDYFYQDHEGFLYFEGRRGDFIKINGSRIAPLSLEKKIGEFASVEQVAVVGLNDINGDRLLIFVRPKIDCNVNAMDIRKAADIAIDSSNVIFVNSSFPVNSNGKIDRKKLLDML